MDATELPPLEEFIELHDLHQKLSSSFPTLDSLRWALRVHRAALVDAGAVILVAGRMRIHPDRFGKEIVAIGKRSAA